MNRPYVATNIPADLYRLTEFLAKQGHDTAHGVLGGQWGYGAEVSNDVFEMHPFWWGDCECGHDDAEWAWEEANPHAADCYQTELARRQDAAIPGSGGDVPRVLAAEWGLPQFGCVVHCTCGQHERWQAWLAQRSHDPACPTVRPNFRHHASGFEVRWYKYIGRDMEYSRDLPAWEWAQIFDECVSRGARARTERGWEA